MATRIASTLLFVFLLATMAPALAQETGTAVATLAEESFYVEAGVDPGSVSTLLAAVETAADHGVDLRIAVFAGPATLRIWHRRSPPASARARSSCSRPTRTGSSATMSPRDDWTTRSPPPTTS